MTLKYESEILFDLMKRDGDDTPSDVLPYESELKEKYLQQVVGAYPKLQDYRPEWLNYNLNAYIPADFPLETLSNVTNATVDNVVPYAYKSAILTGNTEVAVGKNKCNMEKAKLGWIDGTTGEEIDYNGVIIPVEVTGTITISNYISTRERYVYEYDVNNNYLGRKSITTDTVTLTLKENTVLIKIGFYNRTLEDIKKLNLQVELGDVATEYEEYKASLISVKMPVLTTTGKNLCPNIFIESNKGRINEANGGIYRDSSLKASVYVSDYVNVKGMDYITYKRQWRLNQNGTDNIQSCAFYDDNKKYISGGYSITTLTVPSNAHYFRITIDSEQEFQLEQGSQSTSYEPYKSNILSTSEDVTLRGIGDVKDTLDCLNGEMTQRIGEVVLDGFRDYRLGGYSNDNYLEFSLNTSDSKRASVLCDKLFTPVLMHTENIEYIRSTESGIMGYILKSRLSTPDINGLKAWLSSNNITVQYQLATESVKTVDLTVIDQDGNTLSRIKPIEGTMHLSTSGTPIQPTFNGEIPVEATNQNLASFIEE